MRKFETDYDDIDTVAHSTATQNFADRKEDGWRLVAAVPVDIYELPNIRYIWSREVAQ